MSECVWRLSSGICNNMGHERRGKNGRDECLGGGDDDDAGQPDESSGKRVRDCLREQHHSKA